MLVEIIVQTIGFLAMGFGIISYQINKHKSIMILKTVSETLFAFQFFLLGSYTGLAMNAIGIVRNLTFAKLVQKGKNTKPFIVLFAMIMIVAGIFTWNGYISLLAICGKMFTTLAFGFKRPKMVRLVTIPSCLLWIVYDLLSNSIAGFLTEIFGLTSIIIAYFRFDRENKNGGNNIRRNRFAKAHR